MKKTSARFSRTVFLLSSCLSVKPTAWYLSQIHSDSLYLKPKQKEVTIGIIDSGINPGFISFFKRGELLDGYDFVDRDNAPYARINNHGSYLSYLVAGKEIDGYHGIDERLRILPVRMFDEYGKTTESRVIAGIHYAIDFGCQVLNISFGSSVVYSEVAQLIQLHPEIFFVCSVGDYSASSFLFPACLPSTIAVASTDSGGRLYEYSNHSGKAMIYAPGVKIPVPFPDGKGNTKHTFLSGSSYSTAIVSGIIGSCLLSDSLNRENLSNYDLYTEGLLDCRKFRN